MITLSFSRISLRSQLIGMAFVVTFVALLAAGLGLFYMNRASERAQLTEELTSTARLLANRSSAALVFLDEATAQENLAALKGQKRIGSACLFNTESRLFASYSQLGDAIAPCQSSAAALANVVQIEVAVEWHESSIGRLRINSIPDPLAAQMAVQLITLGSALGGALLLSLLVALRLQRSIVGPIARVRDVATAVVETGNYALRTPDLGSHEIGRLGASFNTMLGTIAQQNQDLAQRAAYTQRLFHDSPISQVVLDAHAGTCLDCNQAAVIEMGFSNRDELLDANHPVSSEAFLELRNAGFPSGEWHFDRPDGVRWDSMVHALQFELDGRALVHLSVQNVSARKQAEAALQQLNLDLENRVNARTQELAGANASLTTAMDTLRYTQSELLQKDKLASLGALVAGVAHELNTPLGNSMLVGSSIDLAVKDLGDGMQQGTLTRTGAANMIAKLREGATLLMRNLERASHLITTFKQVAVDQTSEKRRVFDLSHMVHEIVETLQPQFKLTQHRMEIQIPPGISMDSYPGPLGQVITNLVLNTLLHAFDGVQAGLVRIAADAPDGGTLKIRVVDNGVGIGKDNLAKVFDPFFTTKMGQGGSGLGLNIVYNIVHATLGGHIRVESQPGQGAAFVLNIPLTAPLKG